MKRKKWLSLFLTLGMILSGLPTAQAHAVEFTDIQGHWAYDSIVRAVDQGLFTGVSETAFAPEATLTRAMFVTILAGYHGHDTSAYTGSSFYDVPADSWYGSAVAWAAQNGVVSGTSSTTFSPDQPITREQIAVMMIAYANFTGRVLPRTYPRKSFSDANMCSNYALDAVYTLNRAGLLSGMTQTEFGPKNNVTRAQCAVIMCAYMDICARSYSNSEKIFLVNHRGYNMTAPENTLPAFQMSATVGYSAVETDVQFTRDSVPVLLHDSSVSRTSNGSGEVSAMTYGQLQGLDFGAWKSNIYSGTKIPTFEEFISMCKQLNLQPFIELKGSLSRSNAKQLVDIVSRYGMLDNVTWMSFNYYSNTLENIIAWDNTASLGILTSEVSSAIIQKAKELKNGRNYIFLSVQSETFSTADRAACLRNGIDFGVWCIDDRLNAIRTANTTTQFIITDNVLWNAIY